MEITTLEKNALRIKGKRSNIVFDVSDTKKIEANAFVYLHESVLQASAEKGTLLISGPGEYEVSGAKISAQRIGAEMVYEMLFEGMRMLVVSASTLAKMKDKTNEQNIVVLYANDIVDQGVLTNAAPAIVVCYGEKAKECSENFGKGLNKKEGEAESPDAEIKPTEKFVMTTEKLPTELQVVLLA